MDSIAREEEEELMQEDIDISDNALVAEVDIDLPNGLSPIEYNEEQCSTFFTEINAQNGAHIVSEKQHEKNSSMLEDKEDLSKALVTSETTEDTCVDNQITLDPSK